MTRDTKLVLAFAGVAAVSTLVTVATSPIEPKPSPGQVATVVLIAAAVQAVAALIVVKVVR